MGRKGQPTVRIRQTRQKTAQIAGLVDKLLRISTTANPPQISKALEEQKELDGVLQQIIRAQRIEEAGQQVGGREEAVRCFVDWVRENGAVFEGASVDSFPGYELGLKAEMDIMKDSLVIAVPRNMMMTNETAAKSPLRVLREKDQILKNMPNVTLTMFLLVEKFKGDSFWKPYIDLLPKKYTTVLYFSVEDLEELQGSPTLETALRQIKSIARQYAYFYKLVMTSDDPASKILRNRFTYEQYRWAVSTVMTRQNSIPSKDGTQLINALIPLWDLCNHTNGTISTDYNPELERSECLALRDFKAGEQLFIFYGPRTNAELFIHNGFVYEDNVHDSYWLRLGISKSDALQSKRIELLSKLTLSSNSEFCLKNISEPIQGQLIAFLRIFNMSEADLNKWSEEEDVKKLESLEYVLDETLEEKAWNFLLARLKLLLAAYKTTLEEDTEIVTKKQGSANKLLVVRMRATEKRILKNTIECVQKKIKQ